MLRRWCGYLGLTTTFMAGLPGKMALAVRLSHRANGMHNISSPTSDTRKGTRRRDDIQLARTMNSPQRWLGSMAATFRLGRQNSSLVTFVLFLEFPLRQCTVPLDTLDYLLFDLYQWLHEVIRLAEIKDLTSQRPFLPADCSRDSR